jgi:putative NIF3 family GTP cyclohydrolase 1 type 2
MELGLALVDAGHFTTENPAVPALAAYLKDKMPGLAVSISALSGDPFSYV